MTLQERVVAARGVIRNQIRVREEVEGNWKEGSAYRFAGFLAPTEIKGIEELLVKIQRALEAQPPKDVTVPEFAS